MFLGPEHKTSLWNESGRPLLLMRTGRLCADRVQQNRQTQNYRTYLYNPSAHWLPLTICI
jgi:hypothetical protein